MRKAQAYVIQFTAHQVRRAMLQLVEDLQARYPDSEECQHWAEAMGNEFGRNLLRDNVLPRIEDSLDVDWLYANEVGFRVLSSVEQFTDEYLVKIQINREQDKEAWREWRDN